VNQWWKTFFDDEYFRIFGQMFSPEIDTKQAAELWSMLDLTPGCRLLDAPCGWGRLSRPLALLGASVLGVDQSENMLRFAERSRGDLSPSACVIANMSCALLCPIRVLMLPATSSPPSAMEPKMTTWLSSELCGTRFGREGAFLWRQIIVT
jgi:hypothetical protein